MKDGRQETNGEWQPAEHGSQGGALQKRVARGLTWTFVDTWGSQLMSLVIFAILAHLLTKTDFGLVALAIVFVNFAQLFVDQGLGDALIQRASVTRSQIDTAFWAPSPLAWSCRAVGSCHQDQYRSGWRAPAGADHLGPAFGFVMVSLAASSSRCCGAR